MEACEGMMAILAWVAEGLAVEIPNRYERVSGGTSKVRRQGEPPEDSLGAVLEAVHVHHRDAVFLEFVE